MTEAEFNKLYRCKRLRNRIRRVCWDAWRGRLEAKGARTEVDSNPFWTPWVWTFDHKRQIKAREDRREIGPKYCFEDLETEVWLNRILQMDYALDPSKGDEPPDKYYLKAARRYLIDRWRVAISGWQQAGSPPPEVQPSLRLFYGEREKKSVRNR
jgi:hypothetical protein